MPTFYRSSFTELWVTLSSNEVLGILDSDYLEDYFGFDGQITIRHSDGTPYTVLMNEIIEETPSVAHDVFAGFLDLSTVPDGLYTVQGRVRDVLGNYTILNDVTDPFGDERVIDLTFNISSGESSLLVVSLGPIKLVGGLTFDVPFITSQELLTPLTGAQILDVTLVQALTFEAPLLGE